MNLTAGCLAPELLACGPWSNSPALNEKTRVFTGNANEAGSSRGWILSLFLVRDTTLCRRWSVLNEAFPLSARQQETCSSSSYLFSPLQQFNQGLLSDPTPLLTVVCWTPHHQADAVLFVNGEFNNNYV